MSDVGSKRVQEWDLGFLLNKSGTLFEREFEERIINNIRRLDGINESVTHQRYKRVKEGFVVILQTAYLEQALRKSHEEKLEQLEKEKCPAKGEHRELSEALKRVEELQKQITESERTTQLVADKAIQREQKLRQEFSAKIEELETAKEVLTESKEQLEERIRSFEGRDQSRICPNYDDHKFIVEALNGQDLARAATEDEKDAHARTKQEYGQVQKINFAQAKRISELEEQLKQVTGKSFTKPLGKIKTVIPEGTRPLHPENFPEGTFPPGLFD